jgi:hypothetical protein
MLVRKSTDLVWVSCESGFLMGEANHIVEENWLIHGTNGRGGSN